MSEETGLPAEFDDFKRSLERTLMETLPTKRWFGKKSSRIVSVSLRDWCTLSVEGAIYIYAFVDVETDENTLESYFIPLVTANDLERPSRDPHSIRGKLGSWILVDLVEAPYRSVALLEWLAKGGTLKTEHGRISFNSLGLNPHDTLFSKENISTGGVEQSNVSIFFDKKYFMKQYRHLAYGVNPDLEVPEFLTHVAHFEGTPEPSGYAAYDSDRGEALLFAVFEYVENSGDGWTHFTRMLNQNMGQQSRDSLLEDCSQLGYLTAKMHLALSRSMGDPRFDPEPASNRDVEEWRHTYEITLKATMQSCKKALHTDSTHKPLLEKLLKSTARLEGLVADSNLHILLQLTKIRVHGDYHLGQVLKTNKGYIIVDFEGEPLKSLEERRKKGFALKDVAGMLRSISYAANYTLISKRVSHNAVQGWVNQARSRFIDSYWNAVKTLRIVPSEKHDLINLLRVFEAEKALYEVRYELENRPEWVHIPLLALLQLR